MNKRKRIICFIAIIVVATSLLIVNFFFPFKALYRELSKSNKFLLEISEPIIVAQAAAEDQQDWGFFQFPRMCYTENGNILMKIANKPDSSSTYSGEYLYFISDDKGKTWRKCDEADPCADYTVLMDNGMYLQGPKLEDAVDADKTETINGLTPYYASDDGWLKLFDADKAGSFAETFIMREYDPKTDLVNSFEAQYLWNNRQLMLINDRLFPNGNWFYHFTMHAPNSIIREESGSLFAAVYGYGAVEAEKVSDLQKYNVHFLRSDDCGRTWRYVSSIFTDGICPEQSEGLCEPCLTTAPDGRYLVLMRSGPNYPSYISYSADKGESWSVPHEFDKLGVDPQLLSLDCGVTLASYGRPGIYVRATDDPDCAAWKSARKIQLSEENRENLYADSCGYTSLIQIDKYTALLAYSDFNYPSQITPDTKVKTILVRTVHINYNY